MATTSVNALAEGKRPESPIKTFNTTLEKFKPQLALALPKHLNADRMARLALTAFSQSSTLQNCDPKTIVASIMIAGQMGLEIGVSGQGYLVPYKGRCTFVPGWQGIVDIVNRSGRATVWTGAAFQGDEFEYALGDSPFVRHQPSGEDDPKKITHVYAIGRVNGQQWPVIEVWPIERVRRHFNKNNKVGASHYANAHWEMYARKIPLLQVCKYMPKSIELNRAVEADAAAEHGVPFIIDMVDSDTGEITRAEGAKPAPVDAAKTLQQFIDDVNNSTDADIATLALDAARDVLTPADMEELTKAWRMAWENV